MASPAGRMRDLTPGLTTKAAARVAVIVRLDAVIERLRSAVRHPDGDPELVHQLRTSCRRAGATLDAFAPCLDQKAVAKATKHLKRLRRAAGLARDLDVQDALWRRLGDADPGVDRAVGVMLARSRARREAARGELKRARAECRPRRLREIRDRLVESAHHARPEEGDVGPLGPFAQKQLGGVAAELADQIRARPATHEALHAARIQAKQLRYTVEIFRHCLEPDAARALLDDLEALHDGMGDHHDLVVAKRLLDEAAIGPGEDVLGPLTVLVEARLAAAGRVAIALLDRFAADWLTAAASPLAA
ncbi:MAG: CHAD domain-containing protein [Phycisphaeraceae bacterium]|nr:MAG: CHAD domain-containing protein [Phycisphaeraceae bacterium]